MLAIARNAKVAATGTYFAWTVIFNPRHACAERVTWSVRVSVCHHAQRDNERVIPKGSVLHRLDFKFGDFRKSNVFESYGVKTKLLLFNIGSPPLDFVAVSALRRHAINGRRV